MHPNVSVRYVSWCVSARRWRGWCASWSVARSVRQLRIPVSGFGRSSVFWRAHVDLCSSTLEPSVVRIGHWKRTFRVENETYIDGWGQAGRFPRSGGLSWHSAVSTRDTWLCAPRPRCTNCTRSPARAGGVSTARESICGREFSRGSVDAEWSWTSLETSDDLERSNGVARFLWLFQNHLCDHKYRGRRKLGGARVPAEARTSLPP